MRKTRNALPPFESLWLMPGELPHLLSHYGIAGLKLPAGLEGASRNAPARTLLEIIGTSTGSEADALLREHLEALASPGASFGIWRSFHRREPALFRVYSHREKPSVLTMASLEGDGSLTVSYPFTADSLLDWLMAPVSAIERPPLTRGSFPGLPSPALKVLFAIADIFRNRYPLPEPAWEPREVFSFTGEEVAGEAADALEGRNSHSLIAGLTALKALPAEPLPTEAVEGYLLAFMGEGLLALETSAETERYIARSPFLWAIRCLAWWDVAFRAGPLEETGPGGEESLTVFMATGLWTLSSRKSGNASYSTLGVHGSGEAREMLSLVMAGLAAPSSGIPGAPAIAPCSPPAVHGERFCRQCGGSLTQGALFCRHCGKPIAPEGAERAYCIACGALLTAQARFCKKCGSPVSS
ncbi:MAG: zinc ribbon domain-containing protein [Candidatus Eremiobacteraeota bacterium]|nr:zinc ribbon domain-containing protein [Candidatus Eremiobacteraeota bacterium]